jgi:hypothetical protein
MNHCNDFAPWGPSIGQYNSYSYSYSYTTKFEHIVALNFSQTYINIQIRYMLYVSHTFNYTELSFGNIKITLL